MAMAGMPQELKTVAKRILADVIEAKTGHRPNLDNFEPDAKLEGGSLKLTLNGMPPEALAHLKPDAILLDVTNRAKDYVLKVLTLTPTVAETQEMLDLEGETIKALMAGLSVEEGKAVEGAGDDLAEVKVEIDDAAAVAAANGSKGAVTAKGSKAARRHPIPVASCSIPAKGGDKAKPKAAKSGAVAQAMDR
jgi:hypothetical protein